MHILTRSPGNSQHLKIQELLYIIPNSGQIVSLSLDPFIGEMFASSQGDTFYFQTVVLHKISLLYYAEISVQRINWETRTETIFYK